MRLRSQRHLRAREAVVAGTLTLSLHPVVRLPPFLDAATPDGAQRDYGRAGFVTTSRMICLRVNP